MKYFLIAGEASGDIHGAALIAQIEKRDPDAQFTGLGGDRMVAAKVRICQHIRQMAFMGIVAVIRHWRDIRANFRIAKQALLDEKPDVLILIDYPSFNLRMAAFCRKHLPDTKIVYYIPPKVWAWKRRRIHRIAKLCDEVLGIFHFEPDFYANYGYHCTYVGHPTVEEIGKVKNERTKEVVQITNYKLQITNGAARGSIALLPGSRPSEIQNCLPRMLDAARRFPDYPIVVCAAPSIDDAFYTPFLREGETLTRDTYTAVRQSVAAVVNSGTATLETALLGCPQVAVYHIACAWFFGIIRQWLQPVFFSISCFTPVNIIAGKEIIRELVANDFTADNVADELHRLLTDEDYTKKMLASYEHLSELLGSGSASSTAASIITGKP